MAKGYRQGRLGEEIKKVISDLLLRELKDPRLQTGLTSVSAVEVTSDGSYATVYISVLGTDHDDREALEDVLAALRSAKGLIRREIGKQIKLRHIPDLLFKADQSMEYGRHIEEIIDSLHIKKEEDDE